MGKNKHKQPEEKADESGWLKEAALRKQKEKEAMNRVFSGDKDSRQKKMSSLQEVMKKDRESTEEKAGPLYTPLTRDLDTQQKKKKAFGQVFSTEQEKREKQRLALKAWMLGGEEPEKEE